MNRTPKQLFGSCAATKGNSSQLPLQLCAMLLAAAAVAAPAPAAAGKEKPSAAEAPKANGVDLPARAAAKPGYTTYTNFSQVMQAGDARYPAITRVSDPGAGGHPVYTGFFFYQCLQCFSSRTMVVETQRNSSGRWKLTTGTVVTVMGALFPARVVIGSSRTRMPSMASSICFCTIGHPNCSCHLPS